MQVYHCNILRPASQSTGVSRASKQILSKYTAISLSSQPTCSWIWSTHTSISAHKWFNNTFILVFCRELNFMQFSSVFPDAFQDITLKQVRDISFQIITYATFIITFLLLLASCNLRSWKTRVLKQTKNESVFYCTSNKLLNSFSSE